MHHIGQDRRHFDLEHIAPGPEDARQRITMQSPAAGAEGLAIQNDFRGAVDDTQVEHRIDEPSAIELNAIGGGPTKIAKRIILRLSAEIHERRQFPLDDQLARGGRELKLPRTSENKQFLRLVNSSLLGEKRGLAGFEDDENGFHRIEIQGQLGFLIQSQRMAFARQRIPPISATLRPGKCGADSRSRGISVSSQCHI